MSKTNSTVNDAQLKARRTSLEKKTYDELISIILRKDSTERKNNSKIQELTNSNKELSSRVDNFDLDMNGMHDMLTTKQEQVDTLTAERNAGIREIVRLKNKCNLFRKTIYVCFSVVFILIIIIVLG